MFFKKKAFLCVPYVPFCGSKHPLVMTRGALRISMPERLARARTSLQRIPARRAFDQTDRRQHQKENDSENDPAGDVGHSLRKLHPPLTSDAQKARQHGA